MADRRILLTLLQWGITLAALGYALAGIDFAALGAAIFSYELAPLLLIALVCLLDFSSMAIRLRFILAGEISYCKSFRAIILCVGLNNILPAKAGDVIKTFWLNRLLKKGLPKVGAMVIWERVFDVGALALISLASIAVAKEASAFWAVCLPAFICLFIFCRRFARFFHLAYDRFLPARASAAAHSLHAGLFEEPTLRWLLAGMAATAVIWSFYFLSFAIALNYVASFQLTFGQIALVFAITCLGNALPAAPGGLGVFEAAMVLSLSWCGIAHNPALGIALLLHMIYFIPPALGAILIMIAEKWRPDSLFYPHEKPAA